MVMKYLFYLGKTVSQTTTLQEKLDTIDYTTVIVQIAIYRGQLTESSIIDQ